MALAELEARATRDEAALLEYLREHTGRTANGLKNRLAAGAAGADMPRLLAACDNDDALYQRVLPYAGLLRLDTFGRPVVITAGSIYVTAGADRRSTGTHYTPKSLTEPIVQHALDPLVYVGPAEGRRQGRLATAPGARDAGAEDLRHGDGLGRVPGADGALSGRAADGSMGDGRSPAPRRPCTAGVPASSCPGAVSLAPALVPPAPALVPPAPALVPPAPALVPPAPALVPPAPALVPPAAAPLVPPASPPARAPQGAPAATPINPYVDRDPFPQITPEGALATGDPAEALIPRDAKERQALALRLICDRCLYGVDKNPMAVEMAKLSLWLITLDKERPFTFLDHALRCGDSLLGICDISQLRTWSLELARARTAPRPVSWLTIPVGRVLGHAERLRRQIAASPVSSVADISARRSAAERGRAGDSGGRLGADLLVASALAAPKDP